MRANTLPHHKPNSNCEPDLSGLMTDCQLQDVGRVKVSLFKIKDALDAVNTLIIGSGLSIRLIPGSFVDLMCNDISVLAFAHEQAEKRIRAAALATVESEAA
ncbi:MAG: hypothetical protein DID92_2727745640 [Candidatus Nitrotoga sp. SPKER]|nr:MAG: hypothetical protein DID92_2727745640 [Candidatus Nitrotoga sp. SPKER]